jgi:predicted nucleic acid-binding protein
MVNVAYFDSSALVKRYVTEAGSEWINTLLASADAPLIFVSHLTLVEVTCAFARRAREGTLLPQALEDVLRLFEYDVTHRYHVLDVTPATIDTARQLALAQPLRAYDTIQLATAQLANRELVHADKPPLTFLSADSRLVAIAQATGLLTDNPNDHA